MKRECETEVTCVADLQMPRCRLDQWLSRQFSTHSRTEIQRWIREGRVLRAGQKVRPAEEVIPGAAYQVWPLETSPVPALQPARMDLEMLWEDEAVLVVNKPAGVVVHPAPGHRGDTLLEGMIERFPDLADAGDPERPGLVHRLDADTSGVMLFARTTEALAELQRQFRERETVKGYQALVKKVPLQASGTIDLPLGRHPRDRKRRAVNGLAAREALTRYEVLEGLAAGQASRLQVEIGTGRTHQIRVHLAEIGHPVLGDSLYGGRHPQVGGGWAEAPRQMLHAFRLRFRHPCDKREYSFEAPLPQDFQSLLLALKSTKP